MAANYPDPSVQGPEGTPVTIQRQKDGRHAVVDANGQVLGQHNSVFSAARQIHEYYGGSQPPPPGKAEGSQPAAIKKVHGDGKPKTPKRRIPRP